MLDGGDISNDTQDMEIDKGLINTWPEIALDQMCIKAMSVMAWSRDDSNRSGELNRQVVMLRNLNSMADTAMKSLSGQFLFSNARNSLNALRNRGMINIYSKYMDSTVTRISDVQQSSTGMDADTSTVGNVLVHPTSNIVPAYQMNIINAALCENEAFGNQIVYNDSAMHVRLPITTINNVNGTSPYHMRNMSYNQMWPKIDDSNVIGSSLQCAVVLWRANVLRSERRWNVLEQQLNQLDTHVHEVALPAFNAAITGLKTAVSVHKDDVDTAIFSLYRHLFGSRTPEFWPKKSQGPMECEMLLELASLLTSHHGWTFLNYTGPDSLLEMKRVHDTIEVLREPGAVSVATAGLILSRAITLYESEPRAWYGLARFYDNQCMDVDACNHM